MRELQRLARLGGHKAVEHLLELAGDGTAVAGALGLVDDQAHLLALLLQRQHLDGGVGVGQRGGLGRGHDQHFGG